MNIHKLTADISHLLNIPWTDANALRRAAVTLHTWCEQECGDSNDHCSWAIERDEKTDIPYRCIYPYAGDSYRVRIADRERGALKRVERICKAHDITFFYQTDPRGSSLHFSREAMTDSNYSCKSLVAA